MARTARGSTGFVWVAAGAAMILSVTGSAQNGSADAPGSVVAIPAQSAVTEPGVRQLTQQATGDPHCSGGQGHFFRKLTSPPNPFGSSCDLRKEW